MRRLEFHAAQAPELLIAGDQRRPAVVHAVCRPLAQPCCQHFQCGVPMVRLDRRSGNAHAWLGMAARLEAQQPGSGARQRMLRWGRPHSSCPRRTTPQKTPQVMGPWTSCLHVQTFLLQTGSIEVTLGLGCKEWAERRQWRRRRPAGPSAAMLAVARCTQRLFCCCSIKMRSCKVLQVRRSPRGDHRPSSSPRLQACVNNRRCLYRREPGGPPRRGLEG